MNSEPHTGNWGNRNSENPNYNKTASRKRSAFRHMSGGKSTHPRRTKRK